MAGSTVLDGGVPPSRNRCIAVPKGRLRSEASEMICICHQMLGYFTANRFEKAHIALLMKICEERLLQTRQMLFSRSNPILLDLHL